MENELQLFDSSDSISYIKLKAKYRFLIRIYCINTSLIFNDA